MKQKQERDDRSTTDLDVRSKQEREERARLAQQTAQLTSKDYSVEEAFAQFSVLQNVKSRLQQFGYDFFDTQATSFAPVLDAPVGPDYVLGPSGFTFDPCLERAGTEPEPELHCAGRAGRDDCDPPDRGAFQSVALRFPRRSVPLRIG